MRKLVRVDMNQAKIQYEDLAAEYSRSGGRALTFSYRFARGAAAMSSSGSGEQVSYCWRSPIRHDMRQLRPSVGRGQEPADRGH